MTRASLVGAPGLAADARGYVHPRSEQEICDIVRYARERGLAVRVRGSAHSVPAAIHSDARLQGFGAMDPRKSTTRHWAATGMRRSA